MLSNQRQTLLKLVAGAIVGLFLLDRVIISPALSSWSAQGERTRALREKVQRGRQLVDRERSIRTRWEEMVRTDLSDDLSTAEGDVYKAVARWARDSRINFTSFTPQWRGHDEGYDTLECRASATGDQGALGRFLYELETDQLPVRLEEWEVTARDAKGAQLMLNAKFSFIRLSQLKGGAR